MRGGFKMYGAPETPSKLLMMVRDRQMRGQVEDLC